MKKFQPESNPRKLLTSNIKSLPGIYPGKFGGLRVTDSGCIYNVIVTCNITVKNVEFTSIIYTYVHFSLPKTFALKQNYYSGGGG